MRLWNTPTLETERLILRKFTNNDIEALLYILADEEVNTYLPWFPVKSLQGAEAFFAERYAAVYEQSWGYAYAICLKADNIPIGYVNVKADDSHDLGYGLGKEFWHRGIATEAALAVVERVKEDGLLYITATHDVNNPRSGAVMERLGMTYQYSYNEQVQPKNVPVTFKMYQLNFDGNTDRVYGGYSELRIKNEE